MKTSLPLLALALSLPAVAHANDYLCEGTDGVRGRIEVKLINDKAYVTGDYNWDAQSGEDTKTHVVKCGAGKLNNAGRSGNKTHDYYDLKCEYYLRTRKDMDKYQSGYVSLVIPGPADHDSSGYVYANFFCK